MSHDGDHMSHDNDLHKPHDDDHMSHTPASSCTPRRCRSPTPCAHHHIGVHLGVHLGVCGFIIRYSQFMRHTLVTTALGSGCALSNMNSSLQPPSNSPLVVLHWSDSATCCHICSQRSHLESENFFWCAKARSALKGGGVGEHRG
jgi:hypothetical protein